MAEILYVCLDSDVIIERFSTPLLTQRDTRIAGRSIEDASRLSDINEGIKALLIERPYQIGPET